VIRITALKEHKSVDSQLEHLCLHSCVEIDTRVCCNVGWLLLGNYWNNIIFRPLEINFCDRDNRTINYFNRVWKQVWFSFVCFYVDGFTVPSVDSFGNLYASW